MAELEAEARRSATYFLMTRASSTTSRRPTGERALERLRELGHRVGLHAVYPHADLDERFDPVLAWHNPDPAYMTRAGRRRGERDGAALLRARALPLRLEPALALRLPDEALARGEFEWLQLLTHPEIWVYEGETMRESMESMLGAEREARLDQLGEDRIDLS